MTAAIEVDILNLLLVLVLAWTLGGLAERVGYPALMGELLAGIVFGPPLLGLIDASADLLVFAELGVFLLMVYVGMEVDIRDLFALGPPALSVALGGFAVPFALGYGVWFLASGSVTQSLFIGLAMAETSLATKSRILADLDLLDTRIAGILLGGALVSDVAVLVVFAGLLGFVATGDVTAASMAVIGAKALAFFLVALVVGYRFLPFVWARLERLYDRYGFVDQTAAFTLALIVAFLFAALADVAGLHGIIGGFVAGLFLRQAHLRTDLYDRMYTVIYSIAIGFFAPIFFVTVAFNLTLDVFASDPATLALLVAVAFVGKILGTWVFALPTRLSPAEGLVIGLGMNGRGVVQIVIASVGLAAGIIDQELFSILVFIAIFTTALVPATLKWGTNWLESAGKLVRSRSATGHHRH